MAMDDHPATPRPKCATCDGHGAVRAYGPIDDHAACPDCRGTGCADHQPEARA